ncbi:hypothetical protein LXL04_029584 [Taraxacum kok-saghyz]
MSTWHRLPLPTIPTTPISLILPFICSGSGEKKLMPRFLKKSEVSIIVRMNNGDVSRLVRFGRRLQL